MNTHGPCSKGARAAEKGGTFLDTAELYAVPTSLNKQGRSEEILGDWMVERKCRDEMQIATKVAGHMDSNSISANRCAATRRTASATPPVSAKVATGIANAVRRVLKWQCDGCSCKTHAARMCLQTSGAVLQVLPARRQRAAGQTLQRPNPRRARGLVPPATDGPRRASLHSLARSLRAHLWPAQVRP